MPTLGPSPGDIITPPGLTTKRPEAKPSRWLAWVQRVMRSEVQPTVITDRGGTWRVGIRWWMPF